MNDSRTNILSAIRSSLIEGEQRSEAVLHELKERLYRTQPVLQPSFEDELIERFCDKHVGVHGTFERITSIGAIVGAFERYLRCYSLTSNILVGVGKMLDLVEWPGSWQVDRRPAVVSDRVTVSEAFAGIAETGTLVFLQSPQAPTSHLFLAEDHLVVLDTTKIVKYQEEVWRRLRSEVSKFPRTVNFITGPSKTGDVEQTIEYGAHGPRRLHLLLVDN